MQRGFCGLRNVRRPNACKFCARGAPKLRKFCNFFARFRRKICVISTPDARLFGCQRTHDLVKRFEDVMRVAAHAGRVHATFCARSALIFYLEIFAFLSRDFGARFALSRRQTRAFLDRNALSNRSTSATFFFHSMKAARWPSARSFCARGAPDFQKFCNFFARVWRKTCVTSTPDAHFFAFRRTHDSVKSCNDVLRFTKRMLAVF